MKEMPAAAEGKITAQSTEIWDFHSLECAAGLARVVFHKREFPHGRTISRPRGMAVGVGWRSARAGYTDRIGR
jgi:hypothetical protein